MSDLIDVAIRNSAAFHKKDGAAMRSTLHPNYQFKGPMMEMNGPEECVAFMENMPFTCTDKNVRYFQDGNTVVKVFDVVFTQPFQETVSMCEVITFEGGKILKSELFYDTAPFTKNGMKESA